MVTSTTLVEPLPPPGAAFSRSDSIASSVRSTSSNLKRRSRTRTRSLAPAKRGRSLGPPAGSRYESDAGESFLDLDDAPPLPTPVHDEPEEMTPQDQRQERQARRRSRTIGPEGHAALEDQPPGMLQILRSWSALDMRNAPPEQSRGRQAKSDNGSVKGAKSRLRGLSLPRQSFRQNSPSDCSSQPSPQTPYGFGEPPLDMPGPSTRNFRDSVMTHNSSTSSSVYPASTSAGTRTESSMPYTDEQDEADMSYPDIVCPENPDFNPDDVSYRLRLLLNNSYFLPPAHAKPSPLSLSANPSEAAKRNKPSNGGFLDFFRIGKAKSKPTSPVPGSPPAVDSMGPILRTTSDTPTASGLLLRAQPQPPLSSTLPKPPPPPTSRVVVLRERMEDLASAAKDAEKELRNKVDHRKPKSQTTPRDRFLDDIIDPTDAVDLPPPSADSMFAVQASAVYGLGPQESVGAAVLADRLVPTSPGIWSISSEEDSWRKQLLREAVSHSLGNTPEHSFSSSISSSGPRCQTSPTPQSEASYPAHPPPEMHKSRIGQRILENLSIRTASSESAPPSPVPTSPVSPSDQQHLIVTSSPPSGSPKAAEHPMLSATGPPARAETPAHMPLPLQPPPRKQLINPLYSLSHPDLPEAVAKSSASTQGSSSDSYHTVRKATSTPGLSAAEDAAAQRAMLSLSPPPLPSRGISPESRQMGGMPSFSTSRSRTDSDSRCSSDSNSMSFRTPMDTDVDQNGMRPSMSLSTSGRPSLSVSVSEYSMPSPTASAFRDAVFGSCRPPSALSRRSVASHSHDLPSPLPPPTPRSAVTEPPPRLSASISHTELPVPPRPRAVRPTYRPSTSTYNSRSSGSRGRPSLGSSLISDTAIAQDASVNISLSSSSSSPSIPLSARRGFGSPLALTIPDRFQPPVIHSAPAPASPTDFFDRIQSTIHNAMDDLETSDESDSDEEESLGQNARSRFNHAPPGESPSTLRSQAHSQYSAIDPIETAQVFVEPRTQAISNRASSSSARPSIMRLGNHSTPQLSPMSTLSLQEPLPQFLYDPKKPIGNIVDLGRRSFSSSRSPFSSSSSKKAKNAPYSSPLLPIGALPSSPIAPGTSFVRASISSASSAAPVSARSMEAIGESHRRPATATGAEAREQERRKGKERAGMGGRKTQRESIQRFDGMLVQHLAAERDRMKRITNDYLSTSATNSPVHGYSSSQLPSLRRG